MPTNPFIYIDLTGDSKTVQYPLLIIERELVAE